MTEDHYLQGIVIVLGTALFMSSVLRAVRVPSVIGFLLTGIAIGPSGWQLIHPDAVQQFSEFGLIALLFTIGLELSPEPLMKSGRQLLVGTALQVTLTLAVSGAVLLLLTPLDLMASLVLALATALSSTAIVLKQMSDRNETTSVHGLITTGILLVQDILVIAVLLISSLVSAGSAGGGHGGMVQSGIGLLGLLLTVVFARRFLPSLLSQIAHLGGNELITLFAVLMACGGAWLATVAGWSPALGACVAGLLLAEADERHQLVAEITPFRDIFNAVFFISLGMSFDVLTVIEHLPLLIVAVLATLVLKTVLTAVAVMLAGRPLRVALQVGIGLCTVSEFSYVLERQACDLGVLKAETLNLTVAYAVGTMMLGALLYPLAGPISSRVSGVLTRKRGAAGSVSEQPRETSFDNHVIIIGYGVTGSNLAQMLKSTSVPFVVVEMNKVLIREAQGRGATVVVGDAARMSILEHAGIASARVLVVSINDRRASQRIVAQASARRPDLYILVRANFASELDGLYEKGATMVIPEDFETSIEVAAHVLKRYGIPDNIVEAQIASVRTGGYAMLRGRPTTRASNAELMKILDRTTTQTFYIEDDAAVCGKTIGQINLRAQTGCMIIAVVRSGVPRIGPGPEVDLQANDVLVLVGAHRQINEAKVILQEKRA